MLKFTQLQRIMNAFVFSSWCALFHHFATTERTEIHFFFVRIRTAIWTQLDSWHCVCISNSKKKNHSHERIYSQVEMLSVTQKCIKNTVFCMLFVILFRNSRLSHLCLKQGSRRFRFFCWSFCALRTDPKGNPTFIKYCCCCKFFN